MRKLFFICSLCLGLIPKVFAQDSLSAASTAPRLFISVDYGKIATLPTDFEQKIEAGIGFRLGRHLIPVFYAGTATLTPENYIKNGQYTSEGWYIRAGLEYMLSLDTRNNLLFGVRYGLSNFSETGEYIVSSDLFDDVTGTESREDLNASWGELIIGSEMRLGESRFYTGGYFTLRILAKRTEFDPVDTYSIPGYGRTIDKSVPALQLYLKFAIIN